MNAESDCVRVNLDHGQGSFPATHYVVGTTKPDGMRRVLAEVHGADFAERTAARFRAHLSDYYEISVEPIACKA